MFPWIDGFHWSVLHIVFLTLFFAVVLTILSTFLLAVRRTATDFRAHRATEICWRVNFAELPKAERRCRHELAGRVRSRICDNAFDCRDCLRYSEFAKLPAKTPSQNAGINFSDKLLYHRGHTWVRPEVDGTLTVGLDELASRLIGQPDSAELPEKDSEIESNGIAWRMMKNGHEIRVRAPIDGTVVSTGGVEDGWYLRLRPRDPLDLRHLLRGAEVAGWLSAELDRLQLQFSAPNTQRCLADGGTLMPELMDALPAADWDTVLSATFLDS
ncbi:MAG: glycine cleavage system protein H [Candidatus Acidiferrales bacterium]